VKIYNNTMHHTIKMTPMEASVKKNEETVKHNLYSTEAGFSTPKFNVGDKVRITVKKGIFEKGFTPRWTEEVFTISKVQYTDPPTYKITDLGGDEITGTFYEKELQITEQEVFRIEKVIRRKANKSLVKWMGYPDSFNSWVDNSNLMNLK
jgi:hypothetical protein